MQDSQVLVPDQTPNMLDVFAHKCSVGWPDLYGRGHFERVDILNTVNQSPITHHLQTGYDALDCLGGNKILPQGDPLFSLPRADFMGNVLCFSSAG
jgi:hypothetical protein